MFNSSILIKVGNCDLKKALDQLQKQKVHFNSGSRDSNLCWTHFNNATRIVLFKSAIHWRFDVK